MEYNNIGNIYNMIYQRIFILKVIFDIWLIINFIYKLYKDNPHTYFDSFCNVYRSIFMGFVLNYVFVFLCVGIKLFVYAKPSDVDFYFDNLVQYIANEKHKDTQINPIVYGSSTPYVEIKIYKTFRKFISRFENDESTLKTVHSKALIRIERFILYESNDSGYYRIQRRTVLRKGTGAWNATSRSRCGNGASGRWNIVVWKIKEAFCGGNVDAA
jgi:hypothetical protein